LILKTVLLGSATGLLNAGWIYQCKTARIEPTRWLAHTVIEPLPPSPTLRDEASAFGGSSLIAPGQSWPHRGGKSLISIGQINLEEVVDFLPEDAPQMGLLSFFCDGDPPWGGEIEDLGSACILFSPDPSACLPWEETAGNTINPLRDLRATTDSWHEAVRHQ